MVAITARWGGNPPQLYLCVRLSKSVSQRYKKKSSFIVLFRIKSVFLKSSRGLACWFSVENRLSSSLAWGRLVCSGAQSQLKRTLFGHLHIKNPRLLEQRTYVEIEWVKAGRLSPTSVCRKTSLTLIKTGRSMVWSSCPAARNECRQVTILQTAYAFTFVFVSCPIWHPCICRLMFTLHIYDLIYIWTWRGRLSS